MPVVYNLQHRSGNHRNRHALYHFYNTTNHTIPALTLSPNMFYFNTVIQGNRAPEYAKLERIAELSGGNLKKASTMLRGTLRNRYQNIKPYIREFARRQNYPYLRNNNINLNRMSTSKKTHWYQYKRFASVMGLLGNRANPRRSYYNKKQIAAPVPPVNRNLVQKFNEFYRIYTIGSRNVSANNMARKAARLQYIRAKITQNAAHVANTKRRTNAATRIQSVARGMSARRQASAARTAANNRRRASTPALRVNAPAFVPQGRVNAAATANLRRMLGINASRR